MEPVRCCFKKGVNNNWYLIEDTQIELFETLSQIDAEFFADAFDDCVISNIENYTFEFPLNIFVEDGL